MPMSARLPVMMADEVTGRIVRSPPIFRMSCSSLRL